MSDPPHSIAPREDRLLSWIGPWIPRGCRVLDVGAGSGLLAEAVRRTRGAEITLIDVVDNNRSTLPLRLYDGTTLPFAGWEFDVALLAYVLHHSRAPHDTLREACRVARRLVIVEDTYRGPHERLALAWTDWLLNRGHDVHPAWGQLRPEQWLAFLAQDGLNLVHCEEFPPLWVGRFRDPIRHVLLVAEPR